MTKNKIFLIVVAIVNVIALIVIATFSWIDSNMQIGVEETSIQIGSSAGLVFVYDDTVATQINISEMLKRTDTDFYLSECSSVDGKYDDNGYGMYVRNNENTDLENYYFKLAVANEDYISITFTVRNNSTAKNIYIDPNDSHLRMNNTGLHDNASDAIRVALTFGTNEPIILGTRWEDGDGDIYNPDNINEPAYFYPTEAVKSLYTDGEKNGQVEEIGGWGYQKVHEFSDYRMEGEITNLEEDPNALYYLPSSTEVQVRLDVWLEGGSYACLDYEVNDSVTFASGLSSIQGEAFDLALYFVTAEEGEVVTYEEDDEDEGEAGGTTTDGTTTDGTTTDGTTTDGTTTDGSDDSGTGGTTDGTTTTDGSNEDETVEATTTSSIIEQQNLIFSTELVDLITPPKQTTIYSSC